MRMSKACQLFTWSVILFQIISPIQLNAATKIKMLLTEKREIRREKVKKEYSNINDHFYLDEVPEDMKKNQKTVKHNLHPLPVKRNPAHLASRKKKKKSLQKTCDQTTYLIKNGDTLSKIAQKISTQNQSMRIYGKSALLEKIIALNSDTIKNPDRIFYGTELKLPVISCVAHHIKPTSTHASAVDSQTSTTQHTSSPLTSPLTSPLISRKVSSVEITHSNHEVDHEHDIHPHEDTRDKTPSKKSWDLSLAGAALVIPGSSTGYGMFSLKNNANSYLSFAIQLEGFNAGYQDVNNSTAASFSAPQTKTQGSLRYNLMSHQLWIGLGAQYFTFGYTQPNGTTANTLGGFLSIGSQFNLCERTSWESTFELGAAFSLNSTTGASFKLPQVSTYSFKTALLFPWGNSSFYLGPLLMLESISLNLTTTDGSIGSTSFNFLGLGGGLKAGIHF